MQDKIIRYLENKATPKEIIELARWVRTSPLKREEFKLHKLRWINDKMEDNIDSYQAEWDSLINTINRKKQVTTKNRRIEWIRYVAIIIFTIGITTIGTYFILNSSKEITNQTLVWDNGNISKITLPDSSLVIMNSGSSIKYNNNFGISNRNIILTGEAFFKVKKNEKLPFLVTAEKVEIEVLGTQFSVSNYNELDKIEIILKEGNISISEIYGKRKYLINPGELFVFNKSDFTTHIKKVNPSHYISWIEGYQYFYNETLESICKKLEKRFDCKVIPDEASSRLHCTFAIHNENLNQTLQLIKSISGITISSDNDVFYLRKTQ